ncbi:MAG: hypothetical protein ACRDWD_01525 [Acidimicrobiia bacterium]
MSFYDEVMRELVFAVGAALFIGNLIALIRRRHGVPAAARSANRPGDDPEPEYLEQAPVGRTLTFLAIGFVVMVAGLASLIVY